MTGGLNFDLGYDKYAANPQLDGFRQNGIGIFDAELIEQQAFPRRTGQRQRGKRQPVRPDHRRQPNGGEQSCPRLYRQHRTEAAAEVRRYGLGQLSVHHDETRNENASQITPRGVLDLERRPISTTAGPMAAGSKCAAAKPSPGCFGTIPATSIAIPPRAGHSTRSLKRSGTEYR